MKKLRTLLISAIVAVLAFGAVASAQEEQIVIGVAIPAATHGWTGGVNYWTNEAVKSLEARYPNLKFVVLAANSAAQQADQLQDLYVLHNIDALVILPFESDPLTGPVRELKELGIWVTVVDRALGEEGIEDLYVAGDNFSFGRVACEYIAERLGGKGDIIIMRGMPIVIDQQRFDACMEVLSKTEIRVLDTAYANFNRDDAFERMEEFLIRYPKIDAIYGMDDDQVVGIIEALELAGRTEGLFIVGGAGMKEMIERVMNNDPLVPVDVTYPPSQIATALELTALNFVRKGIPFTGKFIIESVLITPENAADFYFPDSPF